MTREAAIACARQHAIERGWRWDEPVRAQRERAFVTSGRVRWVVVSNARGEGERARVVIDDRTGKIDGARLVIVGPAVEIEPAPIRIRPR